MATDKELKRAVADKINQLECWGYVYGWVLSLPIGCYMRGIAFSQSFTDKYGFEIKRCVYPLFESPRVAHIGWGRSRPIPGTTNHHWNLLAPDFSEKIYDLMLSEIIPATQGVVDGAGFLVYLDQQGFSHGWPEWGRALAHVHIGNLDTAQELLVHPAGIIRKNFPQLQQPDCWGGDLLEMLRLLEHDRDAIPAHCEEIARRSVKANKLEKHWTPTPFVYGGS